MTVPDYCAPLVGFREWWVDGDRLAPAIWNRSFDSPCGVPKWNEHRVWCSWPPREAVRAVNLWNEHQHSIVTMGNGVGFYAFKEFASVRDNACIGYVRGEVWLWGAVVEHQYGYRAEYAYPKRFIGTGRRVRGIAAIYGVPVISPSRYWLERKLNGDWKPAADRARRALAITGTLAAAVRARVAAFFGAADDAAAGA